MPDRPIIFSGPMVCALLDGRKTQTRQLLKPQPAAGVRYSQLVPSGLEDGHGREIRPRYWIGDRLWVREGFTIMPATAYNLPKIRSPTEADNAVYFRSDFDRSGRPRWRPSIHMPRWASRLTLTVTNLRVQRLQDISEEDAVAEGCCAVIGETWWQGYRDRGDEELLHQTVPGESPPDWMIEPKKCPRAKWLDRSATEQFRYLWCALHSPDAWTANPWVAAITFTTEQRNIDQVRGRKPRRSGRGKAVGASAPI